LAHDAENRRTFNYTCDTSLGIVRSATDADHVITRSYDFDPFGRNTKITESGGGLTRNTTTTYYDAARQIVVRSDLNNPTDATSGGGLVQSTWYDQLGRVRLTSDPSGATAQTRYFTPAGSGNSYRLTSNPYITGSESTAGWTRTKFDTNGRPVEVQHFTGSISALPSPWGGNGSSTGSVNTSYYTNIATTTDEAGVGRTSYVDGLGRLTHVAENGIGAKTYYSYDTLDNLTNVTPAAGQSRTFTYSSMRRLTSAYNPESGTTSYTYDANGNLSTRTQGGIGTSYLYNELDQITGKNYGDYNSPHPTPWVSYSYNKGWLTVVSAGSTVYRYTGSDGLFDGLGRVTNSSQTTNGTLYNFHYTYNLADGITSTTLPSGRVVNTTYDSAGRPNTVRSTPLGGTQTTYVSSASYATHGALSQIAMGNGITETTSFNARLQPVSIQAGNLLTLGYSFSPSQNNGNVQTQTITRPGVGSWTQTYGYDGVNRLTSANESGTGSWTESYGYDLVGNRWTASRTGLPTLTNETPQGQSWYLPNNQIGGQISGWTYDGAGNLTAIGGVSRGYTYDAENRMIIATVNGSTANYSYDGDGRRVRKITPSATTTYVYDAAGQLAAEYSNATSNPGTEYVTADHLGSTRLVTDGNGATTKCYDYIPYGEEIPNGYAGRTASCFGPMATYPASPDILSQKFTSKERDAETGLDYFGARLLLRSAGTIHERG
jgi:YD repeat-containing protein